MNAARDVETEFFALGDGEGEVRYDVEICWVGVCICIYLLLDFAFLG